MVIIERPFTFTGLGISSFLGVLLWVVHPNPRSIQNVQLSVSRTSAQLSIALWSYKTASPSSKPHQLGSPLRCYWISPAPRSFILASSPAGTPPQTPQGLYTWVTERVDPKALSSIYKTSPTILELQRNLRGLSFSNDD